MARWEDRLESHNVWNVLSELRKRIRTARKKEDPPDGGRSEIERLEELIQYTEQTLNAVDPRLVPIGPLNNINTQLTNASNSLNSYLGSNNLQHLQQANNQADNVLIALSQLTAPESIEDIEGLRKRLTAFRRSAGNLATNIEKEFKALQQRSNEVEERLNSALAEIERKSAASREEVENAFQTQASELKAKIGQYREELEAQKARLDDAISRYEEQFSASQEERRKEFQGSEESRTKQFEEKLAQWSKGTDRVTKDLKAEAEEILQRMRESEKKVIELMEVIGTTGLTGGFQKFANREWWTGIIWQVVALFSLGGVIWAAYWAITTTGAAGDPVDWYNFTRKVVFAASFALFFGYAAKQAGNHWRSERRNRQLQLELASIDPYLADMDETRAEEIKAKLVERWFGRPLSKQAEAESDKSDSVSIVREIKELVANVIESTRGGGE